MSVHDEARRYRLTAQIAKLTPEGLTEVEGVVARLLCPIAQMPEPIIVQPVATVIAPVLVQSPVLALPTPKVDLAWPHAPTHRLSEYGTIFVTCGTYLKPHHFRGADRLDYLQATLLSQLMDDGWQLEAWAVFSNHFHFVAHMLKGAVPLKTVMREFHRKTAIHVNELDGELGRQVWWNFWDTILDIESSYYARLAYTHNNAVKHGLVAIARNYPWCSAAWLERVATRAQIATLARFKTDRVNVPDDYEPLPF